MRTFLPLGILAMICCGTQAQDDTLVKSEMRNLILTVAPEKGKDLQLVFDFSDSLSTRKSKIYLAKLDSLSDADTTDRAHPIQPYIELEKHLWLQREKKPVESLAALKRAQALLQQQAPDRHFYPVINRYMVHAFESARDFEAALIAHKNLSADRQLRADSLALEKTAELDSLASQLHKAQASHSLLSDSLKEEKEKLFYVTIAAASIILLLMIFLIISMVRSRKLRALASRMAHTPELDDLSAKLNNLKNEALQFRKTAEITIDKLNSMDVAHRTAATELGHLQDEMEVSFTELRTQCENARDHLPPTLYMAIHNALTRFNSSAQDRINVVKDRMKN